MNRKPTMIRPLVSALLASAFCWRPRAPRPTTGGIPIPMTSPRDCSPAPWPC